MGTLALGVVVTCSCRIRACGVPGIPEWLGKLSNLMQLNLSDNGPTSK